MNRRKVHPVRVKDLILGGERIYIQSMLNCRADDIEGNVRQAVELEQAGCEIIRFSIPDMAAVRLIEAIKKETTVPLVADIHFDYRLALAAAEAGIDKIRINPGNIGDRERIRQVVDTCRKKQIPIRIGVNAGSLEKEILAKHGAPTPQALVDSAIYHIRLLEQYDFSDIVVSIKSSNVTTTVQAYRMLAEECVYPFHLGVTETGTEYMGTIKSAIGIGSLLLDGIGDTIRVSLTAPPVHEVKAGREILRALGLRKGIQFISCPTCGRTKIDLIGLAHQVEEALEKVDKSITVAVMGCAVNGPGEAREADIGIAGGDGCALLFKKGQAIGKVPEDQIVTALLHEIEQM